MDHWIIELPNWCSIALVCGLALLRLELVIWEGLSVLVHVVHGQQRGTAWVISKTGHLSSLWRLAFEGGSSGWSPAPLMLVYKSFKGVRTANEASTITIWDVISVVGEMEPSQRREAQSGPRLPESLRTATAGGWSEWAKWESLEGKWGPRKTWHARQADTRPLQTVQHESVWKRKKMEHGHF